MTLHVETVIVGGGQAGLSTSYHLAQQGHENVVLEQAARPGNAWRDGRWDSFTLVTPNWSFRLPGAEYQGTDPAGYMPRDEIAACFERYVQQFGLPVRYETRVLAVEPTPSGAGYIVQAEDERFAATNVVVATGAYQQPKIPAFAANLPAGILQLHSGRYRNPTALPSGAVLVVGSGQSGCQIVEELYRAGRRVYLSTGTTGRAPRRYRGRDFFDWLVTIGFFDRTVDMLPSPQARSFSPPQITGKDGGHGLNLHQFARDGVVLLGHLVGAQDGHVGLAPDLPANLARADRFEEEILKQIDAYIARNRLDAPEEQVAQLRDGYEAPILPELDLARAGIGSIIWAAGYRSDYGLVKLPVVDSAGLLQARRGATDYPGLYFAGQLWQPSLKSAFLLGIGESTADIAAQIVHKEAKPGAASS